VNVFDERELELLIGGIADIDVDDWKKHTDYRGYTESDEVVQFFWKVSFVQWFLVISHIDQISSVFAVGMRNKNPDCCSMPLVPHVSLSMASRICKVAMVHVASPSRKLARLHIFPNHTHGTYIWSRDSF